MSTPPKEFWTPDRPVATTSPVQPDMSSSSCRATAVPDTHLDSLVDDIIGKLSIYPNYNKRGMTIKNRKERVKSERPCDWDSSSAPSSSRHSHGYKPYAYPEERKESSLRTRVRPGHQHDTPLDYGAVKDPVEVGPTPLNYTAFGLREASVYPSLTTFSCTQQRHRGASQQTENPLECRTSIGNNQKTPSSPVHDKDTGNNSEDEYYPGTNIRRDPLSQVKNKEHFSPYITEDFDRYICRKKDPTCYGNHVEIQAMAELYNRPVEIYHDSVEPINVFHADYSKEFPIRLSYHGRVHYNSVVDPFKPAFGYGLGMPNYQPNLAEPDLISQAIKESEATQLEEAMLRDKLAETEQSEIDRCIQAQAARESYYEYLSQLNIPVATGASSSNGLPTGTLTSTVRSSPFPGWASSNVASSSTSTLVPSARFDDAPSLPMASYHQGQHIPSELRGLLQ
ncbi:unnamed protein product [Echinostoma caproni]|uniref:ubiquitinyl hydrolase 1 n=1 Tax=Echinostoma caproni TaxID=27848 RepID=A0A183B982_9TREM|nr:unnamed protein product [Echinostoma caproni]